MNEQFLSSIRDFASNGVDFLTPTVQDLYVLNGWQPSTLKGYNSAVQKFLQYKRSTTANFKLPVSASDICHFCFWCGGSEATNEGPRVLAVTLKKYLTGLKAWHDYHGAAYLTGMEKKVGLMLKSTAKDDANGPRKELKSAIMLKHLLALADILSGGPEEDMAIIAFWGMACLGKLTYTDQTGIVTTGPQWGDASVSKDLESAIIVL
ncbi:hypothetical protein MJO29_005763 [Puccinia striiformis f. sp. tritici]|nr:hypothetical protein MJO29_005763 [Puccinia striiformis f. sp. tritici]